MGNDPGKYYKLKRCPGQFAAAEYRGPPLAQTAVAVTPQLKATPSTSRSP